MSESSAAARISAFPVPAILESPFAVPFFQRKEEDPNLQAARADAESALPEGWKLAEDDREGFLIEGADKANITLDVWAAAAEGPNGELEVAVACEQAGAYRALAQRLRGELETTETWAPPSRYIERY